MTETDRWIETEVQVWLWSQAPTYAWSEIKPHYRWQRHSVAQVSGQGFGLTERCSCGAIRKYGHNWGRWGPRRTIREWKRDHRA